MLQSLHKLLQTIAQPSLISLDCESTLSVLSLNKKIETWIFCSMEKKSKKCSLHCEKSMKKSIFSVNINFFKISSTDYSYSLSLSLIYFI